ncbi:hypothetical protein RLEG12_01075 (plasmid) [Rhizobium leguminosarum bv. trifolii CB782]|nr:hypothetical protein RLEG12_01075 [Rhizobium leguminosarum bv. trifolii CB782]
MINGLSDRDTADVHLVGKISLGIENVSGSELS